MHCAALVRNGLVINTIYVREEDLKHFPEYLVCPSNVCKGWSHESGQFTAPPGSSGLTPECITPLQARRAIRKLGLTARIRAALTSLGDEASEEWDFALEIERDNPILQQVQKISGLSQAQMDDIFRIGSES